MLNVEGANDYPWDTSSCGVKPPGFVDVFPVHHFAFYHNLGERIGPFEGCVPKTAFVFGKVFHHVYVGANTVIPSDETQMLNQPFNYAGLSDYESPAPTFSVRASYFGLMRNIWPVNYYFSNNDWSDGHGGTSPYGGGVGQACMDNFFGGLYRLAQNGMINTLFESFGYPQNGNTTIPAGTVAQSVNIAGVGFVNPAARDWRILTGAFAGLGCDLDTVYTATSIFGQGPVGVT